MRYSGSRRNNAWQNNRLTLKQACRSGIRAGYSGQGLVIAGFIVLLALFFFFWPVAVARPSYRLQAINQFNLVADSGGVRVVTCQYCHLSPNGGASWNAFGDRVRSSFKGSIGEALYQALVALVDSDGDGYADILEVFAGTLPGDPNSRPLVTAQFLMKSLEKAGGVDIYKPK